MMGLRECLSFCQPRLAGYAAMIKASQLLQSAWHLICMYHAQSKSSTDTTKDKAMETTKTRQRFQTGNPRQEKGSMAINQDKAKVPRRLPRQDKGSKPATKTRQRFHGDKPRQGKGSKATITHKTEVPSRLPEQDKGSMAINQDKTKLPWR